LKNNFIPKWVQIVLKCILKTNADCYESSWHVFYFKEHLCFSIGE